MAPDLNPTLYSFRRCPYAMRARLALMVSGTLCELREVKLAAKPPAMLDISPKGTVPVLQLPGGPVLDESLDIMRWALSRHDPEGWLGRNDAQLIAQNDGPFKHHLDRTKYVSRHDSDPAEHRAAAMEFLTALEARLHDQPHLCGGRRGLADMAIFPFIRQFAMIDRAWFDAQPIPKLQAWLDKNLAAPLFASVMEKYAVWQEGDAPVHFGYGAVNPA